MPASESAPPTTAGGWVATWEPTGPGPELRLAGEPGAALPAHAAEAGRGVVFDGALYNGPELAAALGLDPDAARDEARLLLHAYRHWGEGLLQRLKGIYALLAWDGPRGVLLAARDPLGIHPLFHTTAAPALFFSPSTAALVRQPGVSRDFNLARLADHLCEHWRAPEETYFEAVRRVPPGCALRVDRAGRSLFRHWDPVAADARLEWVREDQLDQFDALLDQALRRCLRLGPAGIFLSGGLDSVSIAAVAADQARREELPLPWALSLAFPDPESNEEVVQQGVARGLGLPQELITFTDALGTRPLLAAALDLSAELPSPLLNIWLPAYLQLAERGRRHGCRVILTGSGGDEWLTVGPGHAADLLRAGDLAGLRALVDSAARSYRVPRRLLVYDLVWANGLRLWLGERAGQVVRRLLPRAFAARRRRLIRQEIPAWVAPDPALRRRLEARAAEYIPRDESSSFYLREASQCLRRTLLAMEKEEHFETGRPLGMRVLHPYWDVDLVEFLLRTPPRFILQGGRTKGLVRRAMARRFPGLGFGGQKKVVAVEYFKSIMGAEGEVAWQRLDGMSALAALGLVDVPALRALLTEGLGRRGERLLSMVCNAFLLEAWLRARD